eukprot:g20026.t1
MVALTAAAALVAGCTTPAPASKGFEQAALQPYRLDSGDRLRVTVFEQPGLTNTYTVDQAGYIAFPLVGQVAARGQTLPALEGAIAGRLKQGYLRDPDVSIEIDRYRPVFVMGEVGRPGQYSYVPGMTAQNAVAIAGGFTSRGNQRDVDVTRKHRAAGHDVGILCDSSTGGAYEDRLFESIAPKLSLGLTRLPMQRAVSGSDLVALLRSYRHIKSLRPDILHGHGAKGGAVARMIGSVLRANRYRVARVYSPHGGSLHFSDSSLAGRMVFRLERWQERFTDALVFVCDYERRTYAAKVGQPLTRYQVIYNGINSDEFVPVAADPAAADFLYIGMLRDLKGPDVFIRAFEKTEQRIGRQLSALIVGDGPDRERYLSMIRELRLGDRIKMSAAMPAREAFALANTVVVPSRAEAMPYIVLEALAARKPVIASRVGGIPEVLGQESRALAAPGDADDLARIMYAAVTEADWQEKVMPAAVSFQSVFAAPTMARDMLALYQSDPDLESLRRQVSQAGAEAGGSEAPSQLNPLARQIADQFRDNNYSPTMLTGQIRLFEGISLLAIGLLVGYLLAPPPHGMFAARFAIVAAGSILMVLLLQAADAYQIPAIRAARRTFRRLIVAWCLACGMTIAALALSEGTAYPLDAAWIWFLSGATFLLAERFLTSFAIRNWSRNGVMERRAVIVGGGEPAKHFIRQLERQPDNDIRICGIFDDRSSLRSPTVVAGYPKLGTFGELVEFARLARIDMLIIALPATAEARILQLLRKLWILPVDIRLAAHANRLRFRPRSYSHVGAVPMFDIFDKPIRDWDSVAKRAFDITFSLIGVVVLWPVMLLAALAVKATSKGPILFRQKRHGFNNEVIEILKFRSMYTHMSDQSAVKAVTKGDPRVTPVGRFLRKSSIDELPQLFNVLKGELSLTSFIAAFRLLGSALIAFGVFLSGFVISEPAPYELIMVIQITIWFLLGLRISRTVCLLLVLLLVFNIGGLFSLTVMKDISGAPMYFAVSIFLALSAVFYAAIVEDEPARLVLIFNAWIIAALVTAMLGIAGYFNAFPGADVFTRYDRAMGAFQDPNVFGPYLIAPILYMLYRLLTSRLAQAPLLVAGILVLCLGVFLSFSRAAWGLLAFSGAALIIVMLLKQRTTAFRLKILTISVVALLILVLALAVALQFPQVSDLFMNRAKLVQEYDGARLGRFERHKIGFAMAMERPLGLGPMAFGKIYGEDEHNIWLKSLTTYGWLGAVTYQVMIWSTLWLGFRYLLRERPWQPFLMVSWVMILGHALIGNVIDTDHWRHFYLLLGLLWGCIALEHRKARASGHAAGRTSVQRA